MSADVAPSCESFLAIDMGAESSRAIVGRVGPGKFFLEELHRWPTRSSTANGLHCWDLPYIFDQVKESLRLYAERYDQPLSGIGVDSWGVDFGLLDAEGEVLQSPVHYRDSRTDGLMEASQTVMSHEDIYAATGIAFLPFNTLYQLWSMRRDAPQMLDSAATFLMMPDLIHYLLCGVARCETTNASTTQFQTVETGKWDESVLDAFEIPRHIMPEIVEAGTILGNLNADIAAETGMDTVPVIAPCTHDTASAILSIPATSNDWAYISSGTWSLMGAELSRPLNTPEALAHNFTNERGFAGTTRFLKNIMGLWVLQQARAAWQTQGVDLGYDELIAQASDAPPFFVILNIDDTIFFNPENMLEAIIQHCRATGQEPPTTIGTIARSILEGLALRYAVTLHELETVTGQTYSTIHLIGGGSQNTLLCQMASDAMNRTVIAGPAEATSMGNIMAQAIGVGLFSDHRSARSLVSDVVDTIEYAPNNHSTWADIVAPWIR